MTRKYKPNYPKGFDEAIEMLEMSRDENDEYEQTDFLKGYRFGLNMGINALKTLRDNTK